jgi:hypothetical protein
MKNIFSLMIGLLCSCVLFAQIPRNISYQTAVRASNGNLVTLVPVAFKFTIHQGTNAGAIVYEETQTVTTNKDGLATLKVGEGLALTGNFSSIDWSTGLYFLRTKVDVKGGANFLLLTVSQFSSVPYVFYAEKTKSVDYSGLKNLPDVDSLQNILADMQSENAALERKLDSLSTAKPAHFVGEHYGGGVVFYVSNNGKHGLIAATADLSSVRWGGGKDTITHATVSKIGFGLHNTNLIMNQRSLDGKNFAALNSLNYIILQDGIIYDDWCLPSKDELQLMFQSRNKIGGFTTDSFSTTPNYWSSTEASSTSAISLSFEDGIFTSDAKSTLYKVRPIRSF